MMSLSFYKFRQRLEWIALKLGTRIVYNSEEYTRKAHPESRIVKEIGSDRAIKMQDGSRVSRDIVGAFNLMVKALVVDSPIKSLA